jgi:ABC-type oligopeptide transport system substrate-binding subunit
VITIAGEGGVAEPRVEAVADDISTTLGIPVIVEQAPWETFQQELSAGTYEAWVLGWAADYADPQDFLDVLFHSGAPLNYSRYANASVDALLEQARTDADVEHRLHTYAQAERTILDDAPWVPLTSSRDVWLVKPYVHGFSAPPLVVPRLSRVWMSGP